MRKGIWKSNLARHLCKVGAKKDVAYEKISTIKKSDNYCTLRSIARWPGGDRQWIAGSGYLEAPQKQAWKNEREAKVGMDNLESLRCLKHETFARGNAGGKQS